MQYIDPEFILILIKIFILLLILYMNIVIIGGGISGLYCGHILD